MKTTENISLAGYAFTVESDAYAELEKYLEEIQRSFEGNDSSDEIVADIEERIAELLGEMCKGAMTVNVNMISVKRKDPASKDAGAIFLIRRISPRWAGRKRCTGLFRAGRNCCGCRRDSDGKEGLAQQKALPQH